MAIIDSSYFIGEISIPTTTVSAAELTYAIEQVEREILKKLLGDKLYIDYVNNSNDERWEKLVKGHIYTYDDYTIKWEGLSNSQKNSLLAYFTYAHILRYRNEAFSDVGVNKQKSNKSEVKSVNSKMCIAQNKGVDIYGRYNDQIIDPTAFNFIKYGGYTFDDWIFTPIDKINRLGI